MEPTSTFSTLITPAPYLREELLIKRSEVTCGDLQGSYTNVQAPVCTGQTSICTFSNANQGCCDDSGNCQFYTTCNGPYNQQASCTDSNCLSCPLSSAFCVKYNFWDSSAQQGYDGYGCGTFPVDQTTIFGVATSVGDGITSSSLSSTESKTTTESSPSSTPTLTSPTSTPTSAPVSKSHTGAIAGGVVGGLGGAALLLLGAGLWLRRRKRYSLVPSNAAGARYRPQQRYRGDDDQSRASMMSEPYRQ